MSCSCVSAYSLGMHWDLSCHLQVSWKTPVLIMEPKTHCFLKLQSEVVHFQGNFTIKIILSHSSCYPTRWLKCLLAFTSLCSHRVPSVIYYSMSLILDPVLVSAKVTHFILLSKFGISPQVPSVFVTVKVLHSILFNGLSPPPQCHTTAHWPPHLCVFILCSWFVRYSRKWP